MRDVHAKIHGVWAFKEVVAKKMALKETLKKNTIWTFLARGPRMSKHLKMCMLLPHMSILHAINFQNYLNFFTIF